VSESAESRGPHTQDLPSRSRDHATETYTASAAMVDVEDARESESIRVRTPLKDAVRRFSQNWAAVVSLIVVIVLLLASIFPPLFHATSPTFDNLFNTNGPPTGTNWFGTDPEGRDIYSRILYGLRVSFIVSLVGTFFTVAAGMFFGLTAGYFGGWTDSFVSRFTDLMFAFPSFLLTIVIVTLFGDSFDAHFPNGVGRMIILTAVFALVSWPPLMRFVRSLVLTIKEQQFVEAARTVGTSNFRIIWRHLMPNTWGLVLVQAALNVAFIIGAEAVLSIFGLGVNDPTPDLGTMLQDASQYMDSNQPYLIWTCTFLTVLILAFTFIGDGIRDAVDPRSNR
jgi:peptide/nickel transport system permease protein